LDSFRKTVEYYLEGDKKINKTELLLLDDQQLHLKLVHGREKRLERTTARMTESSSMDLVERGTRAEVRAFALAVRAP
jgi:hypothetical protein